MCFVITRINNFWLNLRDVSTTKLFTGQHASQIDCYQLQGCQPRTLEKPFTNAHSKCFELQVINKTLKKLVDMFKPHLELLNAMPTLHRAPDVVVSCRSSVKAVKSSVRTWHTICFKKRLYRSSTSPLERACTPVTSSRSSRPKDSRSSIGT